MKLYKQYVRSHLEFASLAWSPWQQGDQNGVWPEIHGAPTEMCRIEPGNTGKKREDQDMSLVHKLASESIFSDTNVMKVQ